MHSSSAIKRLQFPLLLLLIGSLHAAFGSEEALDEWKIKRELVFDFAQAPQLETQDSRIAISFETKGYCDVTVAIERSDASILRHLASGVLGPNAPLPFQMGTKKQRIVWDGKDDQGRYVDDLNNCVARVSLGLKPTFEKQLYTSPYKRISFYGALFSASPEGVFVFEGRGLDHVRMFDHKGEYVRTVYPFPANKLAEVVALQTRTFPQDGENLPLKTGWLQGTLLTSGTSSLLEKQNNGNGSAATAIAALGNRLALVGQKLNRLTSEGSTGGKPLSGSTVGIALDNKSGNLLLTPRSAAFSPDGKFLYLTGYTTEPAIAFEKRKEGETPERRQWLNCVMRISFEENDKPELFAGSIDGSSVAKDSQLKIPTSVSCDAEGNVYVADYMNDRIQMYNANAKLLKSLPCEKPVEVMVHQKTGEIFVASWMMVNPYSRDGDVKQPKLWHYGPITAPSLKATYPLPLNHHQSTLLLNRRKGLEFSIALDSWSTPTKFWLNPGRLLSGKTEGADGVKGAIKILSMEGGKLVVVRDFGEVAQREVVRTYPPHFDAQHLHVNPATGKLYVAEFGVIKGPADRHSTLALLEIDPDSGAIKVVNLPFDATRIRFDADGMAYLKTDTLVMRFDPKTWREIPWDYGEEEAVVTYEHHRSTSAISGLRLPSHSGRDWIDFGMAISIRGDLAVACQLFPQEDNPKVFKAQEYPGRSGLYAIHLWDKHGQVIKKDAIPGMPGGHDLAIDKQRNIYALINANRLISGKPYSDRLSGNLMKFKLGEGKFVSKANAPITLEPNARPSRPPDIVRSDIGETWVEGVEWMYAGAGTSSVTNSCEFLCGYRLDYFERSFVPELLRYKVAVLDSNGNLILRIGQYGNADSSGPDSAVPLGGDEVGLFHGSYIGVHSDKRLFIADIGNARIVSVKLDYHRTVRIPLATEQPAK